MGDPKTRTARLAIVLALGLVAFLAAGVGLYVALQPTTLRIAVGPRGSDDEKLVKAMAEVFDDESRRLHLNPITTDSAADSLALLRASKADLAVARADLEMPPNAETAAIIRQNYVVLWTAPPAKSGSRARKTTAIKEIADLNGRRVGVIGQTAATPTLLRAILTASGVAPDRVSIKQFGVDQLDELANDPSLDAYMAVGPLDSKITTDAIATTSKSRGEPKFLPIDVSEALAFKNPLYESVEIPPGIFSSSPSWPEDEVETISFDNIVVARKELSEATVAAFVRQLFAVRQAIARKVPGAAHLKKPDTDKDAALPVHRGAAAFIDGNERTFLDRYGDYFWFGLLLLSAIGSAAAWLRQFLKRDDREATLLHRREILAMVDDVASASNANELSEMQSKVTATIYDALQCYDDGALDEEDLAAFGLALELFHQAIAARRATLNISPQDFWRRGLR